MLAKQLPFLRLLIIRQYTFYITAPLQLKVRNVIFLSNIPTQKPKYLWSRNEKLDQMCDTTTKASDSSLGMFMS